jgi:hypothetical protein
MAHASALAEEETSGGQIAIAAGVTSPKQVAFKPSCVCKQPHEDVS